MHTVYMYLLRRWYHSWRAIYISCHFHSYILSSHPRVVPRFQSQTKQNLPRGPSSHWSILVTTLSKRNRNHYINFEQESLCRRAWWLKCFLEQLTCPVPALGKSEGMDKFSFIEPVPALEASLYPPISELLLPFPTYHTSPHPPHKSKYTIKLLELLERGVGGRLFLFWLYISELVAFLDWEGITE